MTSLCFALAARLLSPQAPVHLPLAAAIDLKTSARRQEAAAELARRDLPLRQWLAAARVLPHLRQAGREVRPLGVANTQPNRHGGQG